MVSASHTPKDCVKLAIGRIYIVPFARDHCHWSLVGKFTKIATCVVMMIAHRRYYKEVIVPSTTWIFIDTAMLSFRPIAMAVALKCQLKPGASNFVTIVPVNASEVTAGAQEIDEGHGLVKAIITPFPCCLT